MVTRRLLKSRLLVEVLEGRVVPSAANLFYSSNWSGYALAAQTGAVTSVAGSWTVPTIAKGQGTAYSAEWLGIDGFNSRTVEQIGTEADLINGSPQYYAWYEMYPLGFVTVPLTIQAQDVISATVSSAVPNNIALTLTDATTGTTFFTTQSVANAQLSSAEWTVEAPSSKNVLPLANFGTVTFTGATATIGGTTGPIDNSTWASDVNQIDMAPSRSNSTTATTSALTDSTHPATSSFSVTATPKTAVSSPVLQPPSATLGNHQGHSHSQSPDQVVPSSTVGGFTLASGFTTVSAGNTVLVFASQNSNTQSLPVSVFRPVQSGQLGQGVRPVSLYFSGTGNEQQPMEEEGDGPAGRTPAPATEPAPPQPNEVPAMETQSIDHLPWFEAVVPVFTEDFVALEEEAVVQPVWTGLPEHESKTLAEALVVAGAVLALQPREEDPRPGAGKTRRLQVMG